MMKLPNNKISSLLVNSFFIAICFFALFFFYPNTNAYADTSNGTIRLTPNYGVIKTKGGLPIDVVVNDVACGDLGFTIEMRDLTDPQIKLYLTDVSGVSFGKTYRVYEYGEKNVNNISDSKIHISAPKGDCTSGDRVSGYVTTIFVVPKDDYSYKHDSKFKLVITMDGSGTAPERTESEYEYYTNTYQGPPRRDNPWFMTKGFLAYSEGTVSNSVPSDLSDVQDSAYKKDGRLTIQKYNLAGNSEKSKLDTIMGYLGIGKSSDTIVSKTKYIKNGSSVAQNVYDESSSTYSFSYFITQLSRSGSDVKSVSSLEELKTCSKNCFFRSKDDIHIDNDFVCDARVLIASDNNIYINADITPNDGINGCIFLAKNNIYFQGGSKKSDGSVVDYDIVNGFFIADNLIVIQNDVTGNDGLEIIGGLVAFGNDTGIDESAIIIERNVGSSNNGGANSTNPSLVIVHDPRYSKISSKFFGLVSYVYKMQDGAK